MAHLIPIRIKVVRGVAPGSKEARMLYPEFNNLPGEVRGHMDWTSFIDAHGIGMHYDNQSGFGVADDYNPDPDVQFCATLVPEDFAIAASQMFPDRVALLNEDDFEHFYDARAHPDEPEVHHDVPALQAIYYLERLEEMGKAPQPDEKEKKRRRDALDPNANVPGIRRNAARSYQDIKARRKHTISMNFRTRKPKP